MPFSLPRAVRYAKAAVLITLALLAGACGASIPQKPIADARAALTAAAPVMRDMGEQLQTLKAATRQCLAAPLIPEPEASEARAAFDKLAAGYGTVQDAARAMEFLLLMMESQP